MSYLMINFNKIVMNIITEIEKFIQIYFPSNSFKYVISKRRNKFKISKNIDLNLSKILNEKFVLYKRTSNIILFMNENLKTLEKIEIWLIYGIFKLILSLYKFIIYIYIIVQEYFITIYWIL